MIVELDERELRALHNTAGLMIGVFEEQGCPLGECEFPDGGHGVTPLVSALCKLELAMALEGVAP